MVAVGDAIAAACDEFERDDPAAFSYRGSNLRYAAERALFGRLANKQPLRQAFLGDDAVYVDVDSAVEAAVARRLVPSERVRTTRTRSRVRIAAGDLVWRLRRSVPIELPAQRGGVWFLIDHAKFLRF